jgi:hypothetical protein
MADGWHFRPQVLVALSAASAPQLDARLEQMMKANSTARWRSRTACMCWA